ncbi:hypothetical protein B0H13DRAFT_2268380 [Mycena leptocephala]|nr:hypothetical protein B0H13DRAFT_2268380 [Mycena leptocephala]
MRSAWTWTLFFGGVAVPAVPSLPASISLRRPHLPASFSAVSLLDHAHAHGFGYDHASDGEGEESGLISGAGSLGMKIYRSSGGIICGLWMGIGPRAPHPRRALSERRRIAVNRDRRRTAPHPAESCLRAALSERSRIANTGVSYHTRRHGGVPFRVVFTPLTHWPALARSIFTLHNESLKIHTHFVPMVLWGAPFWGVGVRVPGFLKPLAPWLEVPDARARKWVGEDWPRYTVFGAPDPRPPDAAESLFTLFALACLACSALWHTMAGCAHRGAMEACARVDYVGIGWLIATSIATVVHHGYACAEQAVDATPLGHSILHPSTLLHSGAVEVLQGKAADAVQALMHPSTLLHGAEKAVVESGRWVDGVEAGSVLADMLASFTAPLRALLASLSSPLHRLFNVAASLFAPVLDFASALTALVSATSNATSSLAAWPAYHPVGAGCLLLCAAAGVSGNVLPFCDWFNRVENRPWRLAFFVGISFSALAPLAGIAALQGWDTMIRFVAPVGPSLLYYIVGLVVYATQVPERFLGGRRGWVGWVSDMCGGGSHGIWHIFIVLAMRAHRDGIREMRRAATEGGCAIRAGPGA